MIQATSAQPAGIDSARSRQHARRLELDRIPQRPAGAEVHAAGLRHETQRGDSLFAIARDYSTAFGIPVTVATLRDANAGVLANGLHPGDLLRIPGAEQRLDAATRARNPQLAPGRDGLRHEVARGQTLSSIARHYQASEGLDISWQDLHAANRATIGSNPNLIRPGQRLRIPGLTMHSPRATNATLSDMDQQVLLTRTARVMHEMGGVSNIDVMQYRANGSHAEEVGSSRIGAIRAAEERLGGDAPRSRVMAVAQASDGAYWVIPLDGSEVSDNLDTSDRYLSLAMRRDHGSVVAVSELRHDGSVTTRRYDR